MKATIACAPGAPRGERFSLFIGAWDDPDQIILHGFATCWDAWAFAVCNGMDDPMPNFGNNRRYTNRPPDLTFEQIKMNLLDGDEL